MEASSISLPFLAHPPRRGILINPNPNNPNLLRSRRRRSKNPTGDLRVPTRIHAVDGATDLPPVDITWQIGLGALAGITPFVVAGIEFGKRIVAQRKCGVCGGSGLVQRGDYYARCPGCGGFLPWQSWKRFFTG